MIHQFTQLVPVLADVYGYIIFFGSRVLPTQFSNLRAFRLINNRIDAPGWVPLEDGWNETFYPTIRLIIVDVAWGSA